MKKIFCQGMLTDVVVPRSERCRYPGEVSGLADEVICSISKSLMGGLSIAGVI